MDFHAVEQNLREMFRSLAAQRGGAEVCETGGLTVVSLRAAFQMFNAVFLSAPVAEETALRGHVTAAAEFMESRGLPWSFWICEDWLVGGLRKRAPRIFQSLGLHLASDMPGMCVERLPAPTRPLPELEMRKVAGDAARRAFCDIGSVCFHVPRDWFAEVFDGRMHHREGFRAWLGYVAGQPAATAATVISGGVIGLYNVAVYPEFQGRGYAEAAMRHAIASAHEEFGLERVVLQSTRRATRFYGRLGFSPVTRILVFTP